MSKPATIWHRRGTSMQVDRGEVRLSAKYYLKTPPYEQVAMKPAAPPAAPNYGQSRALEAIERAATELRQLVGHALSVGCDPRLIEAAQK